MNIKAIDIVLVIFIIVLKSIGSRAARSVAHQKMQLNKQ